MIDLLSGKGREDREGPRKRGANPTPRFRPTDEEYMKVKGLEYTLSSRVRYVDPVAGLPVDFYHQQWLRERNARHPGFSETLEISREAYDLFKIRLNN